MPILAPSRGCIYKFDLPDSGGGAGFFSVDGLQTGGDGESIILINNVTIRDNDVVMPVLTLENTRILYTFGSDFGEVTVSGTILLGTTEAGGGALQTLIDFFNENRVSKKKEAVKVSGPASGWNIFITGLIIGDIDPQYHIQSFGLVGSIAQPE